MHDWVDALIVEIFVLEDELVAIIDSDDARQIACLLVHVVLVKGT